MPSVLGNEGENWRPLRRGWNPKGGGVLGGQGLRVSLGSLTQISHTELIAVENNGRRASSNPSCRSVKEKKLKI